MEMSNELKRKAWDIKMGLCTEGDLTPSEHELMGSWSEHTVSDDHGEHGGEPGEVGFADGGEYEPEVDVPFGGEHDGVSKSLDKIIALCSDPDVELSPEKSAKEDHGMEPSEKHFEEPKVDDKLPEELQDTEDAEEEEEAKKPRFRFM